MSTPRRFYKTAAATPENGVLLDQRALRTPGGAAFIAPTGALAGAVAAEWAAQGEQIAPAAMPLTQLAFAAIDHTPRRRGELIEYVAKYAETDLVCHRAESPAELIARQAKAWDPLRDWCAAFIGADLPVVTGVLPAAVPESVRARTAASAAALDDFRLTALAQAAGLAGSAVIGLALVHARLSAEAAFAAAALDELWSLEQWGEDAEARVRLDTQRAEFDNIAAFIRVLGEP
jgi:chaperone required for assembly of F1-ATPase